MIHITERQSPLSVYHPWDTLRKKLGASFCLFTVSSSDFSFPGPFDQGFAGENPARKTLPGKMKTSHTA